MPSEVGRGASRGARSRRHREVETTTLGQSTIYAVPYPWVVVQLLRSVTTRPAGEDILKRPVLALVLQRHLKALAVTGCMLASNLDASKVSEDTMSGISSTINIY
ncbi:hypothetical protein FVEG_01129 [Fusarium verticillioides 7600]|uniref:Uncharacterized protein n=1 Tax=Gibberella moniliformis (strain M3125 / FGSC 7600) TaxID=334819 RepID=W7LPX1_GIBM7|nr:hypothetical protein FVEG_01129 [Fusarium verticillioides 7600]EWG37550.1 hypothetical protein FVEG_01129 [Fusarium verticillioides 7600]